MMFSCKSAALLFAGIVIFCTPAQAQVTLAQGVQTSGSPPIVVPETWFGPGVTTNTWYSSVFASTDATKPTIGGQITVDHAVGGDDPGHVFGMAWFDAVVGRAAGGNIYGRNTVCHADTGFHRLMACYEFDLNNYSGIDAGPPGSANAQYGNVFVGTGANKITAYSWMLGTWGQAASKYGAVYDSFSVAEADVFDNGSGSKAIVGAVGQHQYGFQFHQANFSSGWGAVPNNSPLLSLGANGTDLHPMIKLNTQDAIEVGDSTHALVVPGPLFVKGGEVMASPLAWTPTLTCAGGGVPTYGIQGGSYLVTGYMVQVWFYFSLSSTGGCSGALSLTGLPTTASATPNDRGYVGVTNYQGINAGAGQTQLSGFVTPGTRSAPLVSNSATGAPAVSLTGEMLTTSVVLQGLITYHE